VAWRQTEAVSGALHADRRWQVPPGLKAKDLVGIPWMVAFALRADGWYLRSDIIWHKTNPMPESVTDRPTKSHEYLFLLSKSAKYFCDMEAIRDSRNCRSAACRVAVIWTLRPSA
jgi:DNA modification methylase